MVITTGSKATENKLEYRTWCLQGMVQSLPNPLSFVIQHVSLFIHILEIAEIEFQTLSLYHELP